MALLGGDNKTSLSVTDNRGSGAQQDNNSGVISYGEGSVTVNKLDGGAVSAALASNASSTQSALLANDSAIKSALAFAGNANTASLDFANNALDSTSSMFDKNIDFNSKVMTGLFSNSQSSTQDAMKLMNKTLDSTAAGQNDFMLKLGGGVFVLILGVVFLQGRKK